MYDNHVPVICAAMRASADTFARGILFASLSIQSMFVTIPQQLRDVDRNGEDSAYLWGKKRECYRYVQEHKVSLHAAVCAAEDSMTAIRYLLTIPGIGLVKAGFILQFLGHDVACLDTRNVQREGRRVGEFDHPTPRKIARYLSETQGRARELWDAWCTEVAGAYIAVPDAMACSKIHLDCIVPKDWTGEPMQVPCYGLAEAIPF